MTDRAGHPWTIASDRLWTGTGRPGPGWLQIGGGRIAAVRSGRPPGPVDVDLTGRLVGPGFVDIHNHGGGGASFQSGDPVEVATAAAFHRGHGTTTVLASLVSAPVDVLVASIEALAPSVAAGTIAGVHLEGPWLAPTRCGAHRPEHLSVPVPAAVERLLARVPEVVRMVTVAPELAGGLGAVHRIVAAGAVAAVGHTDASYEVTVAAIGAGATVATHLCNAMTPIHHRAPGPVPACLADPRVAVELVADGAHLHDGMLRHLAATAGAGRAVLVTDAVAAAGTGDGDRLLGSLPVVVVDGVVRLRTADGSTGALAGSALTLDAALRRAVGAGLPLLDALPAVTTAPAAAVGLGDVAGRLAEGRAADLVVLDAELRVESTLAGGRWVGERPGV